jgi:hypothetical protein
MDWHLLFKGDYVSALELGDKTPTLTIADVRIVKLEGEDGTAKDRGVVYFKETQRGWVLAKTNALCLASMFGDNTDDWKGRHVTLFATDVQVGKERKPGIRVKGSPDIAAPKDVIIRLPRKKAFTMRMQKTGAASGNGKPLDPTTDLHPLPPIEDYAEGEDAP